MLHAPTAFVLSFSLAVTCGATLLLLWWQDRRHVAIASWGVGHSLAAIALPLLAARGVLPGFVSIQIGNALMALTYGLIWAGARQFSGRRVMPGPVLAGALAWLVLCQVPAFYESMAARVLAMGLVAAGYNMAAALEFHRGDDTERLRSHRLIVAVLLVNAAVYLFRLPCLVLQPIVAAADGMPRALWFDALVILGTATASCTALLLVALTREKEGREAQVAICAARDAADRANAEKSRFLAHMSHELRTPLNGVLGLAQALAEDPALGGEQRDRAALLERAGRHLNALLNDVLDLSSIEAGRLALAAQPATLAPLLADAAGLARAVAAAKGVRLVVEVAPDLPHAVLCDARRVRQILHNLLGNAVKFTPPGGVVELSVRRRWLPEEGSGLVLTVRDDGPGVPEDFRDRLFQDYSRATREVAKGNGTGLGLAISAGLAQAMNGSIRFGSPPDGKGSVFEVWLPLADAAPPPPACPEPSRTVPAPTSRRVLVVDDVAVNRLVLRIMLERAGCSVAEAESGEAALERLEDPGPLPDVVLMDVLMPGMGGLEAARRIRSLHGPAGRLRILAVTAGAMPEQVAACLAAGMDGHVTKPVERAALLAALEGAPEAAPGIAPEAVLAEPQA
ncbi:hybrid sensor histidine kinase/response regulator [Roseomonas populi]|uniref:histidine kinase n=1 Tax=Roseomonas populi TaxID=3121582 RepID=A0ABT1X1A3_9PROT|nr:ATP-binding protein [Roseomonas pecuniae]MCR0981885.1 response regulator [Roseomonas pecuniae]